MFSRLLRCIFALALLHATTSRRLKRQVFKNPFAIPEFAQKSAEFKGHNDGTQHRGRLNPFSTGPTGAFNSGSVAGLPPLTDYFGTGMRWYNPTRLGGNFYTSTLDDQYPVYDFGGKMTFGPAPVRVNTGLVVHPVNNYVNLQDSQVRSILTQYMLASAQAPGPENNYDPVGQWLEKSYGSSQANQLRSLTAVNQLSVKQQQQQQRLAG